MHLQKLQRVVGFSAVVLILLAANAIAVDEPSLLSDKKRLAAQVTGMFGLVTGIAILLSAFFWCRAVIRLLRSQSARTRGIRWLKTFDAAEYSNEGRLMLAGFRKDFFTGGWFLVLAVAAISGLNRPWLQ